MRILTLPRALSLALALLGLVTFADSTRWIGTRFGGFFLLPNLVIPSIALSDWSGTTDGLPPWQDTVRAVDGTAVDSVDAAYDQIARHRSGEPVQYELVRNGEVRWRSFPARTFGSLDHALVFGTYLLTGLAYLLLASLAAERWSDEPLFRGLAVFGWVGAAFVFTALDIYGPGRLFRVHALAEALLGGAATQLALSCSRDRLARWPGALTAVWSTTLAFAGVYQLLLFQPAAYPTIHGVAQALAVVPVLVLVVELACGTVPLAEPLGPRGASYLLAGAVAGVAMPALLFAISSLAGGSVAVNQAAWTGFVFPLCCLAAVPGLLPRWSRPLLVRSLGRAS
jgi:hypothetical protein